MADVVDIPEFRAFYYTDDTPRQFYTLRRYEDESGSGKMHCYNIAPGIQLSFNDLNLSSCYQPLNVQKDFLEINYCLEGGHEVEMVGGGITFLGEKDLSMTSYKMQAEESMRRIDMILTSKQQPEPAIPQYPDTYEVAFEDVTFAYDNTDHPAVSHLTFMAKAGAITALVGHSGSGKSTAASLIPRFYDVQDGAVKIGGVDIREIPQGDLMKMVAFVFQDPKLFKDSLLENIRAGRPSATREEVLKAAHLAQCDDILKKLPNGIDTIIGSQGIYLSGGETQRISIARAILKDAPIVVLDEATAYADPENEHQIQKAFDGLIKNKTVIMVAHRLSTVQDADQILVMKNGAIAESGTHSDLIKHQGEYAKMWDNYNKTVQWHIES